MPPINPGAESPIMILEKPAFSLSSTKELLTMNALMRRMKSSGQIYFGVRQKSIKTENFLQIADIGESAMNIAEQQVLRCQFTKAFSFLMKIYFEGTSAISNCS